MNSQDQRIRTVLARMELLSYGTTQAFDKSGSRNKATGGNRPPGDSRPAHDTWRELYEACVTDAQREALIQRAETEWENLSKQDRTNPEPGSFHWKKLVANRSDVSDAELCRLYSISRQTLWKYRKAYRV